ncbi:MAG: hypothetical protein ABSG30_06630 [Steroidobacteraceae bacterium]
MSNQRSLSRREFTAASLAAGVTVAASGNALGGSPAGHEPTVTDVTLRAAAAMPNRVGAGASFHGGGLVTGKPDSPHLLVSRIKARYYFGIATNDDAAGIYNEAQTERAWNELVALFKQSLV